MAVYTLLSYTEFCHDGYYNVKGGMYKIVEGLLNELDARGVSITYNTEITGFGEEDHHICYLTDNTGKKWHSDLFVINADASVFRGETLRRSAFTEARMKKMSWTMGYLTLYIGLDCKLPEVNYHNYYLGSNYREYSGKIINRADSPEKPYYYVNVLSGSNPDCAPQGCESLFFVVPVPDLRFKKDWSDRDEIADSIIDDFSARTGKNIRPHIVSRTVYTPEDWQDQYNLHRGSGLGLSHKMLQIGGFRPPNYDEEFRNVFYAGASTIPGTGLPMVLISSKLAAERIEKFCPPPVAG